MWKIKSESDTERVWAHHRLGKESGRYRYEFFDDRGTIETGSTGLDWGHHTAKSPRAVRRNWLVAVPSILLAADLAWQALR